MWPALAAIPRGVLPERRSFSLTSACPRRNPPCISRSTSAPSRFLTASCSSDMIIHPHKVVLCLGTPYLSIPRSCPIALKGEYAVGSWESRAMSLVIPAIAYGVPNGARPLPHWRRRGRSRGSAGACGACGLSLTGGSGGGRSHPIRNARRRKQGLAANALPPGASNLPVRRRPSASFCEFVRHLAAVR